MVEGVHSQPHSPSYDAAMRWMTDVLRSAGAHVDMGMRLRETFRAAGLPDPTMMLEARVGGGRDAAIHRYTAESVRSMVAIAAVLGVRSLEIDPATLAARLREESGTHGVLVSPLIVGAWCVATAPILT
jgi:hypothetical protein